jgi:hypothetical protein
VHLVKAAGRTEAVHKLFSFLASLISGVPVQPGTLSLCLPIFVRVRDGTPAGPGAKYVFKCAEGQMLPINHMLDLKRTVYLKGWVGARYNAMMSLRR